MLSQKTGFFAWLRVDASVIAFNGSGEALAGVDAISSRNARHCHAAHEVAEAYSNAQSVFSPLIERALRP
jgi:hypothetical protein